MARKREGTRSKSKARTASQNAPRGMAGNIAELIERFGTEETCELHIESLGLGVTPWCHRHLAPSVRNPRFTLP